MCIISLWPTKKVCFGRGNRHRHFNNDVKQILLHNKSILNLQFRGKPVIFTNFESSGGKCPKMHKPKLNSLLKSELWRPHKSQTFGRTTRVVLPRLVQSFFVFADELKDFLSERSSPLGLVIFYFWGSGRKILQFYRFPVLSTFSFKCTPRQRPSS